MRTFLFSLLCILALASAHTARAQSAKELALKIQASPDEYYWGYGSGADEKEATEHSVHNLLAAISSKVSVETIGEIKNIQEGQGVHSESLVKRAFSLHSSAHLKGMHTLLLATKPDYRVLTYITKEQTQEVYRKRAERAVQLCIDGCNAEKVGRIDDALRFHFWALCLVNSMETPGDVKHEGNMLVNTIPARIREILRELRCEVVDVHGQSVTLFTTYKGEPVGSVDFRYYDGLRLSDRQSVKDGMSAIELHSSYAENKIQLNYELAFLYEAGSDPEMKYLLETTAPQDFREAMTIVEMGDKKTMKTIRSEFEAAAQRQATPTDDFLKRNQARNYTQAVMDIAAALRKKQYADVKSLFTPEGYEMYDRLLHYGQAEILTIPELHCFPYRDKVICRSIPMRFTYKGNRRAFVEDVTFTFNADGLIESLSFGLDRSMREQIYTEKHLQYWGEDACTMLASFLENYKTAFALHRLDYVGSIFDDNAVIITGHVLKQPKSRPLPDTRRFTIRGATPQQVEYTRQNKDEYLNRLEDVFRSNDFINIHFGDCYVGKMYDEHFGINVQQDYFSTTYSDTGYLFLYIDVSDPSAPLIQYRSWHPERDPDLNRKANADDPRRGLMTAEQLD